MINGAQLLDAVYSIADEKKVDKSIILEGIKEGFQKAYEKHFDPEAIIDVKIDEQTGQIKVAKELKVVQKIEDEWLEISLSDAKKKFGEDTTIDDIVLEPVEYGDEFSRLAILQVGQIIKQKIREAEKQNLYDKFLEKNHEIVGGIVNDITDTSYLIDIDDSIIAIWKGKMIPGEVVKEGERLSVYIEEISKENKFSQVQASRIHPDFLVKLLEMEVPELQDGIVEIKSASRNPGIRAKIAVHSHDESVDPVGSCVGTGGSRIKNVTKELNGEKIDVVVWSENQEEFIKNALAPVRVISIEVDEEFNECTVVVPNEQLSLAIGKQGMAAKLVARLVEMRVNILSFDNAKEDGIEILWNGNITDEELKDPATFVKVNYKNRRNNFKNSNSYHNNRMDKNNNDDIIDEIDEKAFAVENSIDDIQANISAFESLENETQEFDENNFADEYGDYYNK